MKYIILLIMGFLISFPSTYAMTTHEGVEFFNQYENYANSYNPELLKMYSQDAKIIREVVKPDGSIESITIPTDRYFRELKIGQKTAKLRRYKNTYRNVIAIETSNGIKISAERQPVRETYWLKMYQIVQNTASGPKIIEEMMQTKVQTFLKHKNKSKGKNE